MSVNPVTITTEHDSPLFDPEDHRKQAARSDPATIVGTKNLPAKASVPVAAAQAALSQSETLFVQNSK